MASLFGAGYNEMVQQGLEKGKEKEQTKEKTVDVPESSAEKEDQMEDVINNDKDFNWITIGSKVRRYKASIEALYVPGNSVQAKITNISKAIGNIDQYMGTKVIYVKNKKYTTAEFGNQTSRTESCEKNFLKTTILN